MFNKRATALIAAGLLIFAMLASGGCLGDSDSSSVSKKWSLIGSVSDKDRATLKEEGVELVDHKSGQTEATRSVLITKLDTLTDDQKAEIKEMFAESKVGNIALLEPGTAESIAAFKEEILGSEGAKNAIVREDSLLVDKDGKKDEHARIRLYGMMKDSAGNVHSYGSIIHDTKATCPSLVRNDNISKDWVEDGKTPKNTLRYDEKSGCYELVTYKLVPAETDKSGKEKVPAYVAESSVTKLTDAGTDVEVEASDSAIKAKLGGMTYDCAGVQTKDKLYELCLQDDGTTSLYTCDLTQGSGTHGTELTEEEKIAKAKDKSLRHFVEWVREKKKTTEELLTQAGAVKPKTRFEKFMAWAKDLLASSGIAFADDAPANLFEVAQSYSGSLSSFYENLPGLTLTVNTYIVGVHEFSTNPDGSTSTDVNGGSDIYYFTEQCVFTNALEKTYYNNHWREDCYYESHIAAANNDHYKVWVGGAECDEGYMSRYVVTSKLNGNCKVVCPWSQPQTYNNVTTNTVSHGYTLGAGAQAGVSGKSGSGTSGSFGLSLSAGYSSTDSKSYQTLDIQANATDKSAEVPANIIIDHIVNVVPDRKPSPHTTELTTAADLAETTYGPYQMFVWAMATADRSQYSNGLHINVDADVSGAYSHSSGAASPERYTMTPNLNGDIAIPVPPRFCIDNDTVNFDSADTNTAHIAVYSQGAWKLDETTVPSWISFSGAGSPQLTLQPQRNKTGALREAYIKVYRDGGTEAYDTRQIHVTQAVY